MRKKKPKKRKQNKKDPRDELPLRRTISLYKYDKLLKAIFDRIKADDRYTARLVKSYESLSKNFDDPHEWIHLVALKHTSGDKRRMAHKLLEDYRNQMLGKISLEVPI